MSSFLAYSNPVWNGYCADPFVLQHEGMYYAYGTNVNDAALGKRHFVLLRSSNLVNWEFVGGALEPAPGLEEAHHWAPEVAYANGKFYMYYSAGVENGPNETQQRLRIAVADSPEGPFEDIGKTLFPNEGFTIDAHPFRDPHDGQWYLFFSKNFFEGRVGTAIVVVRLADDMVTPLDDPIPAILPSADWHIFTHNQAVGDLIYDTWHTVEGAHIIVKEGTYYCLYSGGAWTGVDYGVSYATAKHPLGPWTDEWSTHGPAVLRGVPPHIQGPGHNSVILAPDGETLICVYHAWDEAHTGRRLCIDTINWFDGGPHVEPTWQESQIPLG